MEAGQAVSKTMDMCKDILHQKKALMMAVPSQAVLEAMDIWIDILPPGGVI